MSAPVRLQGGKRRGRTVLKALSWVGITRDLRAFREHDSEERAA